MALASTPDSRYASSFAEFACSRRSHLTAVAGYWSLDGRPSADACARMLHAQLAYGRSSSMLSCGPISIGRHLYPTVPEDAFDRRPFERGGRAFVADVRLDNRSELSRALELSPKRLSAMSDSELLFECLLRWGANAADRLVGEFAFGFWDGGNHSLLLARDPVGVRPLYYHRCAGFFSFSTMPSGLHALPEVPYLFDSDFMADTLALLPHVGTKTFYKEIERVEPGSIVRVTHTGVGLHRYWNPAGLAPRQSIASDFEEGLRDVVEDAVQARLRGAENGVATHLSSGLDSSIVTTTAARLITPKMVAAFTAVPRPGFSGPVPPGTIADESELAAKTAARYPNIEHICVHSSADTPLRSLERNHSYFQQPSINLDNEVWSREINRTAAARGLKVLLIGSFGNVGVTYSGMELLPWLIGRGRVESALAAARSLASHGVPWRTLAAQLIGPFVPRQFWKLACSVTGRPKGIGAYSSVRAQLIPDLNARAFQRGFDPFCPPSADPMQYRLSILSWVDVGNYFKGVLAEFGLSVRDPLSDKRVIEYCLSVPAAEYLRGGVTRSLARRAFSDRLPHEVITSIARGYQSADWYEAVERDLPLLCEEVKAIARSKPAAALIDMERLRQTLASWPEDGWAREEVVLRYRYSLLRAVQAGHFMRKVSGSN